MEKSKGFAKHAASSIHLSTNLAWNDYTIRIKNNTLLPNIINIRMVEENIYYVKSIIKAIKCTIINELPFRGDDQNGGFLNNILIYTKEIVPKFAQIANRIPVNAKYTSPTIQNEIITIIHNILEETIIKEINESKYFIIKCDETKDKSHVELLSIVIM